MTADVIALPKSMDALAERIRSAYARTEQGRQEWIEGTLDLALALSEARTRFHEDRKFSIWLAEKELDQLGAHDRASLINMAADLPLARAILQESKRSSWRLIWSEEMVSRFDSAAKPDLSSTEQRKQAFVAPAGSHPTVDSTQESAPICDSSPPAKPLKRDHPFHGFERAEEVTAIYASIDARGTIGKALRGRGGKVIWSLILQAIDEGFLRRTETQFATANLRILFPGIPKAFGAKFDLTSVDKRQQVRDIVMPAAIANREVIIASPEQMESILITHAQRQHEAVREQATRRRVDEAVRAMPSDQREVIVYGVRLWPRIEHRFGSYEYDQLCAAIWYVKDLDAWLQGGASGNSVRSRVILIRHSTRWPEEYIERSIGVDERTKIKKLYQLVHTIAGLLESNADGECIIPPTPKIEGQW